MKAEFDKGSNSVVFLLYLFCVFTVNPLQIYCKSTVILQCIKFEMVINLYTAVNQKSDQSLYHG